MINSKKEQTLNKYLEDFLKEKSEEERLEFLTKNLDRQYSAVMAWKRRRDIKRATAEGDASNILDSLNKIRMAIDNSKSITREEATKIRESIGSLSESLDACIRRITRKEIEDLSRQQEEIARRLEQLRGENNQ